MPKVGKRIITPEGEGKVVRQNVLEKRVVVALSDGREVEFGLFDLKGNGAVRPHCDNREAQGEQDLDRG